MDRFIWVASELEEDGQIAAQDGVCIYDGEQKTTFEVGIVKITQSLLMWDDQYQRNRKMYIPLSEITKLETENAGLFKSAKILVHLLKPPSGKEPGPCYSSQANYIKLSFRSGGQNLILDALRRAVAAKEWIKKIGAETKAQGVNPKLVTHRHAGIGGIERKMEEKYKETDQSINEAFKDLDALMVKAKDMVTLAEKFSAKLQEKQVSITDDETVAFKSYLLSMGIANPVTRQTHGSDVKYYEELAKELASFLKNLIEDEGGVMTLTDVYCRFNRARGMELVSPDDVTNAAQQLERLGLRLRFRKFETGVMVIESLLHSEEEYIKQTAEMAKDFPLTAEELSRSLSIPVTLAKERLLAAENAGKICRDDTVEGLRFYKNLFLCATSA